MSDEMLRFAGSVSAQTARCQARIPALVRSMEKTARLFPLGTELARTLSEEEKEALEAPTEDGGAYLAAANRMPGVAAFLVSLIEWAPQEGWLDPSALPDEVDLDGGAS